MCIFAPITISRQMKKKSILYFAPQSEWSILDNMELICTSPAEGGLEGIGEEDLTI